MAVNLPRETLDDLPVQRFQENVARAFGDIQTSIDQSISSVKKSIPATPANQAYTQSKILDVTLNYISGTSYTGTFAHGLGVIPKAAWFVYTPHSSNIIVPTNNNLNSYATVTMDSTNVYVTWYGSSNMNISIMVVY